MKEDNILTLTINKESTTWWATAGLRYLETANYIPATDSFEKILQQLWQGNNGHTEWRDVEIVRIRSWKH